ncbi:Immediate early response 3-interacting protein 1-like protein [Leptotrombidium deliense]|uniref:Immediate early response 3-interacting protein 1 n=1 Tax=Leptotrombidium deliense TaxID=299467 RepID=A0A443SMZ8_9ACAR|nr:Immediate early response 3-interacting protein 1-like protein [Leptotrombidium deliense]
MPISIYTLYEATLLVINAIAVLHEERFLAKYGWGRDQAFVPPAGYGYQPQSPGVKANLLNFIHSIRTVMRIPLIFLNVITIIYEVIAG